MLTETPNNYGLLGTVGWLYFLLQFSCIWGFYLYAELRAVFEQVIQSSLCNLANDFFSWPLALAVFQDEQ